MLTYAAPALLVAVAVVHVGAVAWTDLTPWRGGGFGMFSTTDRPSMRVLRTVLETSDGTDVRVALPRETGSRTLVLPSERVLRAHAARVAEQRWEVVDRADVAPGRLPEGRWATYVGQTPPLIPEAALPARLAVRALEGGPVVDVAGVRAEVWRLRFRPSDVTLEMTPLVSVTVAERTP